MEANVHPENLQVSSQNPEHLLLCRIGNQAYGFGVGQVREVLTHCKSHSMPVAMMGIKGLVAIRGHVFPLVDVGLCLPVSETADELPGMCLVVCEVDGYRFCIRVNQVIHVIDQLEMTGVNDINRSEQNHMITHAARVGELVVLVVDLGALIQKIRPIGSDVCCV